jgi:hypothetical protein
VAEAVPEAGAVSIPVDRESYQRIYCHAYWPDLRIYCHASAHLLSRTLYSYMYL